MAEKKPPRAIILADGSRTQMREAVDRLRPTIERHVTVVHVSLDFESDLSELEADLVIVLGGDGSILRAARQMGYQDNNFPRNLRIKKTNTIGVIIPRLNSYFMSTVIAGMEKVANDRGYILIISQSQESVK